MIKSLLLNRVKVNKKIVDTRLRLNFTTNTTIKFTKKSFFFYTILGFTQSHSGVLGDIEGFVQLILGSYKSSESSS